MINRNNIHAVIFDLGRVLVNIDNGFLVENLFRGMQAADLQELGQKTMRDPAMIEFNTGRIEAAEFHRHMCDHWGLEPDFEVFKKLWCQIFYTMDGMETLITQIAPTVRIGLLSDTDPIHWNYIKTTWPWIGKIANPTLSYEVGVMKPDKGIFLTAAENVSTPPQHCLFIDDLQVNVDGARAAGMQAIQFKTVTALVHDLEKFGILPDSRKKH